MADDKSAALADAMRRLDWADPEVTTTLARLWDVAFERGRLAALDELQDRFCVCMK
jgi:hypothetical protein